MLLKTILLVVTLIYFTNEAINLREVKYLVQGHPAGEWKSWSSAPFYLPKPSQRELARVGVSRACQA